jgi:transcriptional regulator with XRE-family HTH domain
MSTYGKRLKELRKLKKMTQKELSNCLDVSSTTISRYESEEILPTEEIIVKTALVFHCSSDYLLGLSPCEKIPGDFIKEYDSLKQKEEKLERLLNELTLLKEIME